MDDIFILWTRTQLHLKQYALVLKYNNYNHKFTLSISNKVLPFLDLEDQKQVVVILNAFLKISHIVNTFTSRGTVPRINILNVRQDS